MDPRLKELVEKIEDKSLRVKVAEFLKNPTIEIAGKVYSGMPLSIAPAGLFHHHCYQGGLVEHIVSTSEIALTLCKLVKEVYQGEIEQDLVLSGILLHDIFKPLTYSMNGEGHYVASPLGERVNHLPLIVSELIQRGFPLNLVHIVCAHHGSIGPIRPKTVEALVCHLSDSIDSQLNREVLVAARHLAKNVTGREPMPLTTKEAFEIVRSKAIEGWAGVKKIMEKLKE